MELMKNTVHATTIMNHMLMVKHFPMKMAAIIGRPTDIGVAVYLRTECSTYTVRVYTFRVYTHSTCYSGYVSCTEIFCGSGKPTKELDSVWH